MNINKDMLKDVTGKKFVLNQHNIEIDGETKTHWDIRINEIGKELSLTSNPIDTGDVIAIEKKLRPLPSSVVNTVSTIDQGMVNIIEESNKTTFVFGGEKLKGTWTGTKDNICIIPDSIRLQRESDV